jgi:hypothetical protein
MGHTGFDVKSIFRFKNGEMLGAPSGAGFRKRTDGGPSRDCGYTRWSYESVQVLTGVPGKVPPSTHGRFVTGQSNSHSEIYFSGFRPALRTITSDSCQLAKVA